MRRADAKQRTREALLRAGMELFAEQGLDGPSLDGICERAGYTRGAFYVHFADRDAFLVAVMDHVGRAFLDAVIGTPSSAPNEPRQNGRQRDDLPATARRFLEAVAAGAYPLIGEGGVRPHQLLHACARSPIIRQRYVGLVHDGIERIGRIARADQRARRLRSDVAPDALATLLLAAVVGAQTLLDLGVRVDLAQAANALLTMLEPKTRIAMKRARTRSRSSSSHT